MTELEKIIRSRKSTYPKDFCPGDMSQVEIEAILSMSAYAPNHKKTHPWRFQVYTQASKSELQDELGSLYQQYTEESKFSNEKLKSIKQKIDQSAAVIAIIHHVSHKVPAWEEVAAIAMAVQNMWLKATEMNIGGYWSTIGLIEHLNAFLHLEENQRCIGLFYLGRIKEAPSIRNYEWEDKVTFYS